MSHQLIIKGSLQASPLYAGSRSGCGSEHAFRHSGGDRCRQDNAVASDRWDWSGIFRGVSSFAGRSGTTATILIGCRPINGVWVWFFRMVDCCPGARLRAILPLPMQRARNGKCRGQL